MQLLLRRKERLRCFPSAFVFRGRKPIRGTSDSASESQIKQLQGVKFISAVFEYLLLQDLYF